MAAAPAPAPAPAATARRPRILCVDDEPQVLQGLQLNLRKRFDVVIANSGDEGLKKLAEPQAIFEVIISDMRMPGIDGATFLARAREKTPDTTRMLLTGHSDIEAAMRAVNDGQIFRFLSKPCPPDTLLRVVDEGARQYRLVTAERELLDRTLRGCVRALTDILTLTNPEAFGRATRIKRIVLDLCATLMIGDVWAIEVAALVSQLGVIILPNDVAQRAAAGRAPDAADRAMLEKVPVVTRQILANIPRLEPVLEILELSTINRAAGAAPDARREPPSYHLAVLGADILRLATDYDALDDGRTPRAAIVAALRARAKDYDPQVLDALAPASSVHAAGEPKIRSILLTEIKPGMVLAADVKSTGGMLLAARGHELTAGGLERLRNFARTAGVHQPILVIDAAG